MRGGWWLPAVLAVLISGCTMSANRLLDGVATYFPTMTPAASFPTDSPTALPDPTAVPSATAVPLPAQPPTPTPLCVEGLCLWPTPGATLPGQSDWEYLVTRYYKLRCVAQDSQAQESACNLRSRPHLGADTLLRTLPYGSEIDAAGLYHCQNYTYCDPDISDWYLTADDEWAARLDTVWRDITPED